jgi:high-affinity nickel-transport protein
MGLMVAAISLSVAAFGLARWMRADVSQWYEGRELVVGAGVIVLLAGSFAIGSWLARSQRLATAD